MSEDYFLRTPEQRAEADLAYEKGRRSKAISAGMEKSEFKATMYARALLFSCYAFTIGILFGAIVF